MKKLFLSIIISLLALSSVFGKVLNFAEYRNLKKDTKVRIDYVNSITSMPKWSKTSLEVWKLTETITVYLTLGTEEQKKQALKDFFANQDKFSIQSQIIILHADKRFSEVNQLIEMNKNKLTSNFVKKYYTEY